MKIPWTTIADSRFKHIPVTNRNPLPLCQAGWTAERLTRRMRMGVGLDFRTPPTCKACLRIAARVTSYLQGES